MSKQNSDEEKDLKNPKHLDISSFHEKAKDLIRRGKLKEAIAFIQERLGPESAAGLFSELTEEIDVEKKVERDIILEGLGADDGDDVDSEVFAADPDVIERLQSQGIVAPYPEDEDEDDDDWAPFGGMVILEDDDE